MPLHNRPPLLHLLLLIQFASPKKSPPNLWDAGPCEKLQSDYGTIAACRQCKDPDRGFGSQYAAMVDKALPPVNPNKQAAWLRIAIGTIPRSTEQPYLERVLMSIADELPHNVRGMDIPLIGRIEVLVANFRPGQHPVFNRVRKKLAPPHPASEHFTFVEIEPNRCDPPVAQDWEYKGGLSPEVSPRQQTRDVISLYKAVRRIGGTQQQTTCQHALFVEDDFELCPGGLHLIKHAINKASKGGWSGLRVGVAGNGIIVPCDDIDPIASYLTDHQFMMPVDLLLPEWFIRIHKRAKRYLHESAVFRINDKNLFNHIGTVSSFKDGRGQRRTSMCGDILKSKTWMKEESFNSKCSSFGLSPCGDEAIRVNTVDLKYHSGSHVRSVPGHVQVIRSMIGESCTKACMRSLHTHGDLVDASAKAKGLGCRDDDFIFINNCRYLRREFSKCRGGCVNLQSMVAQDEISHVPKNIFGALSPGIVGQSKLGLGGVCWHRQSNKKHIMVSHLDVPSSCSSSHPMIARLCPCTDISLIEKK